VISASEHLLSLLIVTLALTAVGQITVRVAYRRSLLSAHNVYLLLAFAALVIGVGVGVHSSTVTDAGGILSVAIVAMGVTAARQRSHALGAGGDLREHELSRRWIWQPRPERAAGERVYIGRQDEIVHLRPWRDHIPYVSMTALRSDGPRLPLGEGQHIFLVGATGSGKTTTARRVIAARVLVQKSSLLVLDQKGDPTDVEQMRRLAATAGVPFVLFDSEDQHTDRWQPLWGSPGNVAARATVAIKESEPYYYDVLRKHLDIVCKVLYAADRWPPSVPFLIDACEPTRFQTIVETARHLGAQHEALRRKAERYAGWVRSRQGTEDLSGGALRLETALALASSTVVTPRVTADGDLVGVRLIEAMRRRAVVMWRTHADAMPDEAAALTTLALADLHAAAAHDVGPWTVLLDEFGAVIAAAAHQALAILQRARSHHGQAVLITQSIADVEALTNTPRLLDSLTDNFAGIVAHEQKSPDSRDWLARLMGTRELWQSTNQTDAHGAQFSGRGSSRRVREFRVPPDTFNTLQTGEAVIHTSEGLQAQRATIAPLTLPAGAPQRINLNGPRHTLEVSVWPQQMLPNAPAEVPAGRAKGRLR
jgi:TraM recognition site of TraD and TraG/Type IV secretion-system coupling protein DNA-binding domain